MSEIRPTLEELFEEYQAKFNDVLPVMQRMGIPDEELYDLLGGAIARRTPLGQVEET